MVLASCTAWPGSRNEETRKPLKSRHPSGSAVSFSTSQPSVQPQRGSNSSSTSPSLMPAARTLSDARASKSSGCSTRLKVSIARLRGHSRLEVRTRRFTRTRRWPGSTRPRLTGSPSLAFFNMTAWPLPPKKVNAFTAATSLLYLSTQRNTCSISLLRKATSSVRRTAPISTSPLESSISRTWQPRQGRNAAKQLVTTVFSAMLRSSPSCALIALSSGM
mmetsp:Transcript_104856/g.292031  ORF Transcript_104856/g.292031 Transcript_104856/m.292031 type:complete len:219 (-) Transcript_104856:636-1292(-)